MKQYQTMRSNEEFIRRLQDQIDQMERCRRMIVTPFFTPEETMIVQQYCGKAIAYVKDGGYAQAERVRFAFLPFEEEVQFPTTCLKAAFTSTYSTITHRDVLGALMNLGLRREMIGDLIVEEQAVYILCDEKIENYICTNLTKIKHTNTHFTPYEGVLSYEQQCKIETIIVSSLRLDTIVASLAHLSRAKAGMMIKNGLIKVNHTIQNQPSYTCKEMSELSIRGSGRFCFHQVIKHTKKEHLVIEIGRYL